jgi:dGTPase
MLTSPFLFQATRFYPEKDEPLVQATELDRAKIVQSGPVRRLQQKTQVFPLDVKASVRSRLTHSLEVQQTGRQILFAIQAQSGQPAVLPAMVNLLEMSCLLHDIGNPPFGHFGEAVLRQWLGAELDGLFSVALKQMPSKQWQTILAPDLCHFDGNAQSLRLVHSLQRFNLTLSQLACMIKYPRSIDEAPIPMDGKVGVFISERQLIQRIRQTLQLAAGIRHPLVFIMEAADDIAYSIADVDDAVDRHLLTIDDVCHFLLSHIDAETTGYLTPLLDDARHHDQGFFPRLRLLLTLDLVDIAASSYIEHLPILLSGNFVGHLLEKKHPATQILKVLQALARKSIFTRTEVESLELSGYAAMRGVLNSYSELLTIPAAGFQALIQGEKWSHASPYAARLVHRLSHRQIQAYLRSVAERDAFFTEAKEQEWYYRVRLLIDFISGMTDTYVLEEYRLLNGWV